MNEADVKELLNKVLHDVQQAMAEVEARGLGLQHVRHEVVKAIRAHIDRVGQLLETDVRDVVMEPVKEVEKLSNGEDLEDVMEEVAAKVSKPMGRPKKVQ